MKNFNEFANNLTEEVDTSLNYSTLVSNLEAAASKLVNTTVRFDVQAVYNRINDKGSAPSVKSNDIAQILPKGLFKSFCVEVDTAQKESETSASVHLVYNWVTFWGERGTTGIGLYLFGVDGRISQFRAMA